MQKDPFTRSCHVCRSLRIVLFGFQVLSAGIAFVIGSTQFVAALADSPGHLPLQDVAQVRTTWHTRCQISCILLPMTYLDDVITIACSRSVKQIMAGAVASSRAAVQGLGIDAVGILIFGYLLKRDLDAREQQIARMTREEDLGSLQIELANKKTLRLAQLRQFARVVSFEQQLHKSGMHVQQFASVLARNHTCVTGVQLVIWSSLGT